METQLQTFDLVLSEVGLVFCARRFCRTAPRGADVKKGGLQTRTTLHDDVMFLQKPSSDLDGWRWRDLCEEVKPFPQSSSLIPSSLSFVQQDLHTKPAAPSSSAFTRRSASPQTETAPPLLSSQRAAPPRRTEGGRSEGSAGEEEQRHGGKEELQSCPMCLQDFPSGSSQMDRDSHLAQCLSDMNVDVTW
uniref:UBZ2-type domain-containing protein n=1 Tax=Oryzias latipes TaxID=8090 RepID=A0A3P9MQJ5_ORYLA